MNDDYELVDDVDETRKDDWIVTRDGNRYKVDDYLIIDETFIVEVYVSAYTSRQLRIDRYYVDRVLRPLAS